MRTHEAGDYTSIISTPIAFKVYGDVCCGGESGGWFVSVCVTLSLKEKGEVCEREAFMEYIFSL